MSFASLFTRNFFYQLIWLDYKLRSFMFVGNKKLWCPEKVGNISAVSENSLRRWPALQLNGSCMFLNLVCSKRRACKFVMQLEMVLLFEELTLAWSLYCRFFFFFFFFFLTQLNLTRFESCIKIWTETGNILYKQVEAVYGSSFSSPGL